MKRAIGVWSMPYNPESKKNLGKPRTKAGRRNFTLKQETIDWLSARNASDAIDGLVSEQMSIERLAQWLADTVKNPCTDGDAGDVIAWSDLCMRDVWERRGENVEDWNRMYGEKTATERLHCLHEWVGDPRQPGFWERNAIALLADPDIAYLVHEGSGEKFVFY